MSQQKLGDKSKEELIEIIKKLKKQKKYGLVWEEKPEEVVERCKNELPVLEEVKDKAILQDPDGPTNLLIEGDNYHALSVLNYTHAGKIDVIYADPPFNTGSSSWIYNNKIVDANDHYRHSKWLSFMRKRLILARSLLKENGLIAIAIDDYELYTLGLLMDEVFGEKNKVAVLIIENNPRGRTANKFYATSHEYYLVYAKNVALARVYNLPLTKDQQEVFKYNDDISPYRLRGLRKSGADSRRVNRPKQYYPIYIDKVTLKASLVKKVGLLEMLPIDNTGGERVWIIGKETCATFIEDGTLVVSKKGEKISLFVKDRIKSGRKARTVWVNPKYDTSSHGATLLLNMFGKKVFDYPKSVWAIRDFLYTAIGDNKNAVILDYFAGSGTTGHAVLELNKEDGGRRQFILCTNNENKIAEDVTYPRIKKVIEGYGNVKGIPANYRYFKTSFVTKNYVSDDVKRELMARSTEMICVKEGTFEEVKNGKAYKILCNKERATGILFDLDALNKFKKEVTSLGLPVHIYVFSLTNDTYDEDFEDLNMDHELCPIPESILEVYRKIFK